MHRIGILLGLIALVLSACTPSTSVDTSTTTIRATTSTTAGTTTTDPPDGFGGEGVIGVGLPVLTLNPFSENAFGETRLVGQAVWATIYDIDPETWERIPETVTSLPSQTPGAIEVDDDGSMTVRYEVRAGATWSDGTPITGADIEFTAVAMFQLAIAGAVDVDPVMATVTETDSVERVTWITFSEPSLAFEDALWVILPSHSIERAIDVRFADGMDWPAGGPFMVSDAQESGSLSLERNPHYWKTDEQGRSLPYLDSLTIVSADEPGLETDLFVGRSVDVIVVPPSPEAIESIPESADTQQVATPIVEHVTFQFGEGRQEINPLSNNDLLDYRKAIAHSIDRSALVDETGVPWMRETPGMLIPLGSSAWDAYPPDPAAGTSLIEGMHGEGVFAGPPMAVLSTTGNGDYRIRIGDALVGSLDDIGVDLETSYVDSLIFFGDQLSSGAFDIGMWAWVSDGGYMNQLQLMELFDPASDAPGANHGNWGEGESGGVGPETFSELVAEARSTVDSEHFNEIVAQAEEILAEYLPLIPLFHRSSIAAVWADSLTGVIHNGSKSDVTWNVEMWGKPGE